MTILSDHDGDLHNEADLKRMLSCVRAWLRSGVDTDMSNRRNLQISEGRIKNVFNEATNLSRSGKMKNLPYQQITFINFKITYSPGVRINISFFSFLFDTQFYRVEKGPNIVNQYRAFMAHCIIYWQHKRDIVAVLIWRLSVDCRFHLSYPKHIISLFVGRWASTNKQWMRQHVMMGLPLRAGYPPWQLPWLRYTSRIFTVSFHTVATLISYCLGVIICRFRLHSFDWGFVNENKTVYGDNGWDTWCGNNHTFTVRSAVLFAWWDFTEIFEPVWMSHGIHPLREGFNWLSCVGFRLTPLMDTKTPGTYYCEDMKPIPRYLSKVKVSVDHKKAVVNVLLYSVWQRNRW